MDTETQLKEAFSVNLKRLTEIASKNKYILNPDTARINKVVGLMTNNFVATGEYFCPCKQQNKPPVKGKDTICPCREWHDEIARDGYCHCKLFFSVNTAK
jgi:ferredoxin-thioredoxin reductase catalytic subunit